MSSKWPQYKITVTSHTRVFG